MNESWKDIFIMLMCSGQIFVPIIDSIVNLHRQQRYEPSIATMMTTSSSTLSAVRVIYHIAGQECASNEKIFETSTCESIGLPEGYVAAKVCFAVGNLLDMRVQLHY